MERIKKAKKSYDEIPIPDELSKIVEAEVNKSKNKRKKTNIIHFRKYFISIAASFIVICTVALNTNVAFANAVEDIPVIGVIAKVLTFRSYETKTDDLMVAVDIPKIETISEEFKDLENSVNEEIYNLCEKYSDESVERAMEYKKAFLETGGTEEEWKEHNLAVKVWYEVKCKTDKYLSLIIRKNENWNNAGNESKYYNLDLKNAKPVQLEDLFGKDYAGLVEKEVLKQMKAKDEIPYFDLESLEITADTNFYINEMGNPVIVFAEYEIAPGAFGEQEFEIKFDEKIEESQVEIESDSEAEATNADDNFSVASEDAESFAKQVKAVVADKNFEAIADLIAYPVYIGFEDGGKSIDNKEDFLKLEVDSVLTEDLIDSVTNADISELNPSMAGFVISESNGAANIVFGLRDGKLAITGINH
ncbi:MAG: RsiV family protein [Eubacteriales bacterium]|nr:RsiV family protein [Eubacteriales bacterium]